MGKGRGKHAGAPLKRSKRGDCAIKKSGAGDGREGARAPYKRRGIPFFAE